MRRKISKVLGRSKTTYQHFHPKNLSLRGVLHNLNLKGNYLHSKAIPNSEALCQKHCSGLRHQLSRGFPSPVRMELCAFLTSDRGRFGCCVVTLGGAVPFPRVGGPRILGSLKVVFAWTAYPGLLLGFPYGEAEIEGF